MTHPTTYRLGNIWLIAATVARTILPAETREVGEPFVVRVDADGNMTAVGSDHPDYVSLATADPSKVCVADSAISTERFAGRLRDAVLRGEDSTR